MVGSQEHVEALAGSIPVNKQVPTQKPCAMREGSLVDRASVLGGANPRSLKRYIPHTSKCGGRPVSDMWSENGILLYAEARKGYLGP